ncbi:MAG: DmsE family decaheme c-type cytochrome [Terriglobales bacterium]
MKFLNGVILTIVLVACTSVYAGAAGEAKTAAAKPNAGKNNGDYVGTDTCITCHDLQYKHFKNTVMGKVFANPRTAAQKLGCEACHGPGKAHVEAGGGKDTIPIRFGKDSRNTAEEQNAACLTCHQRGNRLFWKASPHQSRGMTCVDCHQVMQNLQPTLIGEARFNAPLSEINAVKKSQPELCFQCHQMRRAQLQRSSHMPFREGKVTCTSCHNPHGSPNPSLLIQATLNENCYSCHAERRGPFLWAHPPVTENCGTCHDVHGSTNPQLLKVRTPRLCQQCHTTSAHGGFPGGNVLAGPTGSSQQVGYNSRVLNRGCTNCHSKIHGTNATSGKFFIR